MGFEELVESTMPDVWRFVRRRTASATDADDVTAEVYATAWRRRADLPEPDARRLWLFGVARNVLANHRRADTRRARLGGRLAALPAAPVEGPEAAADPGLWRALAALDEDDRELLLLRAWDGLAVTDLAVLLGCTPNAASLRLQKARRRLAAELARTDDGAGGQVGVDPAPLAARKEAGHG